MILYFKTIWVISSLLCCLFKNNLVVHRLKRAVRCVNAITWFEFVFVMIDMNLIFVVVAVFQITQQLEGICLQVIGTVLQQHVLGEQKRSSLYFHIPLACCIRSVYSPKRRPAVDKQTLLYSCDSPHNLFLLFFLRVLRRDSIFGSQPDLPAGVATDVATPSPGVWSLPAGWFRLFYRFVFTEVLSKLLHWCPITETCYRQPHSASAAGEVCADFFGDDHCSWTTGSLIVNE